MILSLNGLRFVFAILVVLCHYILPSPFNRPIFSEGGTMAVHFFFILSGFLLTLQYEDRIKNDNFKPVSFLLKKLSKIYPLHLLVFLLFFVWKIRIDPERILLLKKAFFNVLLLQSYIPDTTYCYSFNFAAWYLCDLIFLYVVFAFFSKYLFKSKKPLLLILIIEAFLSVVLHLPSFESLQ